MVGPIMIRSCCRYCDRRDLVLGHHELTMSTGASMLAAKVRPPLRGCPYALARECCMADLRILTFRNDVKC